MQDNEKLAKRAEQRAKKAECARPVSDRRFPPPWSVEEGETTKKEERRRLC
jgi:hypothetical protein